MNELARWAARTGRSQQALAEELGVSQAHVSRLLAGQRTPSDRLKVRVAAVTGGEVPPESWFSTLQDEAR